MRVREFRQARFLSQQDLADASGVSKGTVIGIELGRRTPHPRTVRKLAAALGVEPAELTHTHLGDIGYVIPANLRDKSLAHVPQGEEDGER